MPEFGDIVGQDAAIAQLQNAISTHRMPHAFLFVGPEGIGRRTTAVALARTLLCENPATADTGSRVHMWELIGDALRNAAMRFGAALDLWHKGDLHADEEPEVVTKPVPEPQQKQQEPDRQQATDTEVMEAIKQITACTTLEALGSVWSDLNKTMRHIAADKRVSVAKDARKDELPI